MARNEIKCYVDIVQTHPEKSVEELEELIAEADKESSKLKEWPKT